MQPFDLIWCRETESNRRHKAFQASALPTELSRHKILEKISEGIKLVNVDKEEWANEGSDFTFDRALSYNIQDIVFLVRVYGIF